MASRGGADHYAVLGVAPAASVEEIRRAYRERARSAHPDVVLGDPRAAAARMAAINDAWACLSDARRRAEYDISRGIGATAAASWGASSGAEARPSAVPAHDGPARIPWRAMRWMLVVGVAAVIGLSFVSTESVEAPPDQLLQTGSCVVIDDTDAVSEVSCSGAHDAVVRQLVAFDRTCPTGTESFRDRQGMGLACVVRAVGGTEGGG